MKQLPAGRAGDNGTLKIDREKAACVSGKTVPRARRL